MVRKRKIDVFDLLSPEMSQKVDELGYSFLQECGYKVNNATQSASVRSKLKRQLDKDGRVLTYKGLLDNETREILIYFHLVKKGTENSDKPEILMTSKGLKFVPKAGGESEQQSN